MQRQLKILLIYSSLLNLSLTQIVHTQDLNQSTSKEIRLKDDPSSIRIKELTDRGLNNMKLARYDEAIKDCDAILNIPEIDNETKYKTLMARVYANHHFGLLQEAIKDCDAALDVPGLDNSTKIDTSNICGMMMKLPLELSRKKIQEFDKALANPKMTAAAKAEALLNRGGAKAFAGQFQEALKDYQEALKISGIKDDTKSMLLINCGMCKYRFGQFQEAIDDYTAALKVPGIKDKIKADALFKSGMTKGKLGRSQDAINDFEAALKVPGVTGDLKQIIDRNHVSSKVKMIQSNN